MGRNDRFIGETVGALAHSTRDARTPPQSPEAHLPNRQWPEAHSLANVQATPMPELEWSRSPE
jgi:hypothetical protein